MAFFDIHREPETITWNLSKGDRKFHFVLLRIYPWILIIIGIGTAFFLSADGEYEFLWMIGLLPLIPAIIMLFTEYPLRLIFSKGKILVERKNTFRGTSKTFYELSEFPVFYTEYNYGKYGGQEFGLFRTDAKMKRLAKVPWTRLKKANTILELKEAAEFAGFEFRELPNTLHF